MKVAHFGHSEIYVPDLAESKQFFIDVVGLSMSDEDADSVYLRAWQDWEHHTLVLRRGDRNGLGHVAWRVESPASMEEFARHFDEIGVAYTWVPAGSERGQGEAIRFTTPGGIPTELYWEMDKYYATDPARASGLPSFPEKFPIRGIAPRRLDHFNVLVNDVRAEQEWLHTHLGIKHRYYIEGEDGQRLGSWNSITNLSHDVAIMHNRTGSGGMLHHHAYYLDSPDELLRAATIVAQHGGTIEWGPGRHGTSGAIFLYFFEPGGNRIEVWTAGMLVFPPDWEPIRWDPEAALTGFDLWGTPAPQSYFTYGSPPVTTTDA